MNKKNIIVTGASGDIGNAICEQIASEDVRLFMIYHSNKAKAQKLLDYLTQKGFEAYIYSCNLSISKEVDNLLQKINTEYGGIFALINNAGKINDSRLENMSDDAWNEIIVNNLYSCFYCTRKAFSIMKSQKSGKIINISSTSAIEGNFGQSNYVAAKCGIIGLTKTTAIEGSAYNIRSNVICPGIHKSKMIDSLSYEVKEKLTQKVPLKYIADCKEIAYSVEFLLSDKSDYITGQTICVNGGLTMV